MFALMRIGREMVAHIHSPAVCSRAPFKAAGHAVASPAPKYWGIELGRLALPNAPLGGSTVYLKVHRPSGAHRGMGLGRAHFSWAKSVFCRIHKAVGLHI
jgi:hypothetical protein